MSIFTKVQIPKRKRSNFDLSHEVKTTTEFGRLTPILCQEVLPGDSFQLSSQVFARMAPMIAPIMSQVDVYTHFFFVPNRLIWDKWEDFITGGKDGKSQPPMPTVKVSDIQHMNNGHGGDPSSLADYLGIPPGAHPQLEVSVLPFRAYQLIYNEWYRDQNCMPEVDILKSQSGEQQVQPGTPDELLFSLKNRCWQKDYFTSALPWPQRGDQVQLPLQGPLKVQYEMGPSYLYDINGKIISPQEAGERNGDPISVYNGYSVGATSGIIQGASGKSIQLRTNAFVNPQMAAPTINEVRRSLKVQQWLEATARGGARYIEQILSHFGVRSSDARIDRPELLGGGRSPIMVSEVLQTSQTSEGDNGSPQGNMAGHGVSAQATHGFKRYFEEHGFLIGILSIMPKATYMNGLHKMWSRRDKFDYAWPEFANLGEQPIKNQELFCTADLSEDKEVLEGTFGYTPRYAEYKYQPGSVHGSFRNSMLHWHLGRSFQNMPKLNSDFLKVDPSYVNDLDDDGMNRIFAVLDEKHDHFYLSIFHRITAKRVLPYYGTPTI